MGREELFDATGLALTMFEQLLEHRRHSVRVVARRGHGLNADVVRLFFGLAAEPRERAAGNDLCGDLRELPRVLSEDCAGDDAQPVLARDLFGRVTRENVA